MDARHAGVGELRRVDPRAPRGSLYRTWARLVASPFGLWLSRHIGWKVDPHLLRLTGGRLGTGLIIPTALLETRGARSGQPRRNGVIYFHDGEKVTLIASKAGAPEHPSWYYNARANPEVRLNGQEFRAEAIEDEQSRARLWALADRVFPPFATYRESAARSGRTIPILQLVAVSAGNRS
jgi:deazaflavin-dependent oxidoreductase (nitroreductase family)